MAAMLDNINKSPGLILVYSAFRSLEGIGIFALVLETNGWIRYDIESANRPNKGEKRFAIYSGEEDEETREKLRAVYNAPENKYGEELMALLVTSAGAEGIDLKNIRQVQIMEPFWHDMRINQVVGRANRYLSHIELPEKDREVDVFRYMSVLSPEQMKLDPEKQTTDEYMYEVALRKLKLTEEIKKIMKESAVDCVLNAVDNEKDIQCFTYGVGSSGLGYKANIREDLVYGKTEMAMKTVKKTLVPMFLDDDNNLIFADAKKKKLCYFYNKECKSPLKEPPKSVRKVAVDMATFEVFDVESAKYGNPVKLGDVDEKGQLV
jgi:Helicase conserved C-terminal domain